MIIRNDIISEASLVEQTIIGNMIALDASSATSYPGTGTKWYDLSGNLNHVTWQNSPTWNSAGYFTFNGTSNYGTAPDSPTLGIDGYGVTIEVWVRFSSLTLPYDIQFLLSKNPKNGGSPSDGGNYGIWIEPNFILCHSDNGSGGTLKGINGANNVANTWYQIVFIQDANGYKVIRNGSVITTVYGDGTPALLAKCTDNLYIGKRKDTYHLYGDLAVINVWDRALTDVEVLRNYNFYRPRFA